MSNKRAATPAEAADQKLCWHGLYQLSSASDAAGSGLQSQSTVESNTAWHERHQGPDKMHTSFHLCSNGLLWRRCHDDIPDGVAVGYGGCCCCSVRASVGCVLGGVCCGVGASLWHALVVERVAAHAHGVAWTAVALPCLQGVGHTAQMRTVAEVLPEAEQGATWDRHGMMCEKPNSGCLQKVDSQRQHSARPCSWMCRRTVHMLPAASCSLHAAATQGQT